MTTRNSRISRGIPTSDEIYERFRETAQILINPYWESICKSRNNSRIEGRDGQTTLHPLNSRPSILEGFASVTMASANFRDTLVYRIWSQEGVQFEVDKALSQSYDSRNIKMVISYR